MSIGFGIVGCGMIANFHAKAIEHINGAKDRRLLRLVHAGGGQIFGSQQLHGLSQARRHARRSEGGHRHHLYAVGAHRDPAVAAANAGKHVIVEKPLEITLARCDAIINACRKNKVRLCTIFPSRYSAANRALKQAIDDKRFGRLTLGDSYVKWWRSQEYYDSGGWRGTWALDGGGAFMNQAIHNVDLLYWFMGEVAEVVGITDTLAHQRIEVEDVGVAAVRFKNGALGTIEATTSAHPGLLKKTEIHGTEGTVIVEQDDVLMWQFAKKNAKDAGILRKFAKKVGGTGGASDPSAISYVGHMEQIKDFLSAIQTGSKPLVDGEEGRKSVEIILAIYQSSWTGKRVALPLSRDPKRPA